MEVRSELYCIHRRVAATLRVLQRSPRRVREALGDRTKGNKAIAVIEIDRASLLIHSFR
jgi:hypothetical protein